MSRDTEFLKVQTYSDSVHSRYTVEASFLLGVVIAYIFVVFGFQLQGAISLESYLLLIFVPVPFFGYLLYSINKEYRKKMARVDVLIRKINIMQSLPTIADMSSGKAWENEADKKEIGRYFSRLLRH
jgi:hypothetical protein